MCDAVAPCLHYDNGAYAYRTVFGIRETYLETVKEIRILSQVLFSIFCKNQSYMIVCSKKIDNKIDCGAV